MVNPRKRRRRANPARRRSASGRFVRGGRGGRKAYRRRRNYPPGGEPSFMSEGTYGGGRGGMEDLARGVARGQRKPRKARKDKGKKRQVRRAAPKRKYTKRASPRKARKARKSPRRSARTIRSGGWIFTRRGSSWVPTRRSTVAKKRRASHKRRSNPRRYRRRATNPKVTIRRRRRRSTNPKVTIRRRRRRHANPKVTRRRSYRRRRNTWAGAGPAHRKAAKKGWRKRRAGYHRVHHGKRSYRVPYLTRSGRKYHHIYRRRRGSGYSMWRNFGMSGIMNNILPIGLGLAGFIGALWLTKKMAESKSESIAKFGVMKRTGKADLDLKPILIPIAAALGLMMFGSKIKFLAGKQHMVQGVALGLGIAGAVAGVGALMSPDTKAKLGLHGYTVHPMAGYVRRPFSGYVTRAGMGQLEDRRVRTLGDAVKYQGAIAPSSNAMIPMERAVAYGASSAKPYGLGLPIEARRYNEFDWGGVYDLSNYEN